MQRMTAILLGAMLVVFAAFVLMTQRSSRIFAVDERLKLTLNEISQLSDKADRKQSLSPDELEAVCHDYDFLAQKASSQALSRGEKSFMQCAFFIFGSIPDDAAVARLIQLLGNDNFSRPIEGNGIIFALAQNERARPSGIPALINLAEKHPQFKETVIIFFFSWRKAPDAYIYVARNVNSPGFSQPSRQGMYYITGNQAWALLDGDVPQSLIDDFIRNPAETCKITPNADNAYPEVPWH